MELLAGIICISFAAIGGKDKRNPIFLFCTFWAVLFFAGSFYWTGFNRASVETIIIMIIGVAFFALGGKFGKMLGVRKIEKPEHFHSLFIDSVCIIGSAYWTLKMIKAVPYLLSVGSFSLLRKEFWVIGGSITPGLPDYIFNMFFANGIALAIPAIAFTELFKGEKKTLLIFGSIYMSIAAALCNGGRLIFMNLLVCVLGALILSGRTSNFRKALRTLPASTKRTMRGIIFLIIIACVFLTIQRQSFVSNIFESIYNYFTLQFSLMSTTVDLVKSNHDITYGATSTMGITQPIAMVFQFLGVIDYPEVYNVLAKYTSPYFDVGASIPYNAFVSQFFFFYLDGRILGVIFFDFIIGMICEKWYLRIDGNQQRKYTAFYIIALVAIVQSSFRFCFTYPSNVIALLVICATYSSKKIVFKFRGEKM